MEDHTKDSKKIPHIPVPITHHWNILGGRGGGGPFNFVSSQSGDVQFWLQVKYESNFLKNIILFRVTYWNHV